jgi:competence ComEA-like helix-hairpin-helix protein
MWGREMRAGVAFVLLSLLLGGAFREWRRASETRFEDLVRELEAADVARSAHDGRGRTAGSTQDSLAAKDIAARPRDGGRIRGRARPSAAPALRPGGIDVNRAPAQELERLPGIGPSLAARIVAERERNGTFQGADALLRVPGIGPRTLERIRPYLALPRSPADSGSPIAN